MVMLGPWFQLLSGDPSYTMFHHENEYVYRYLSSLLTICSRDCL